MAVPALEDAVREAAHRAGGVVAVYVFGSAAQGREHRDSDIDLAVLFDWAAYPSAAARFEARIRLIGELGTALARNDVDLVVLNDAPPGLARAVVGGRRLFLTDAAADHAFVRDTLLRAADLDPWLRRMRARKLDRLAG